MISDGICGTGYTCENTDGSYTCTDYNECSNNQHDCKQQSTKCSNLEGSYECIDVDECLTSTHNCATVSKCVNRFGSYKCECNEGYKHSFMDTLECVDINECMGVGKVSCSENQYVPLSYTKNFPKFCKNPKLFQ